MNKNIEYEKLVAEIHQAMLNHDGFENFRVEHDVKIEGKSGAIHQIDVFWEFKAADTLYRTCIECKNYRSAVKKSHVAAFSAILEDIGNANGIIATTESYQKGAKLFAKEKNIRLVLVNYLIKTINFTSKPRISDYQNFNFEFDTGFMKSLLEEKNIKSYTLDFKYFSDDPIYDKNSREVSTFGEIINNQKPTAGKNRIETDGFYISTDLGMLPIKAIAYDLVYIPLPALNTSSTISVDTGSKAVLQDIVNHNIHYLNDDGTMKKT